MTRAIRRSVALGGILSILAPVAIPSPSRAASIAPKSIDSSLEYGQNFGIRVAFVDDCDRDGIADILISAPTAGFGTGASGFGRIYLVSGKTLKMLRAFDGTQLTGRSLAVAAPDGVDESRFAFTDASAVFTMGVSLTAKAETWFARDVERYTQVFSVSTCRSIAPWNDSFAIARQKLQLGGKGATELLVLGFHPGESKPVLQRADAGALCCNSIAVLCRGNEPPEASIVLLGEPGVHPRKDIGKVIAYHADGTSKEPLYTCASNVEGDRYGFCVCAIADVDGDGVDDALIGAPGCDEAHNFREKPHCAVRGRFDVISGTTGKSLATRAVASASEFGTAAVLLDTRCEDGSRNVALAAFAGPFTTGFVEICSSKTLRPFRKLNAPGGEFFGAALATGRDLDGDGQWELLVSGTSPISEDEAEGVVFVVYSRDSSMKTINPLSPEFQKK